MDFTRELILMHDGTELPAGFHLDTTFVSPTIWTGPFAAASKVEPLLPGPDGQIGFREVELCHEVIKFEAPFLHRHLGCWCCTSNTYLRR